MIYFLTIFLGARSMSSSYLVAVSAIFPNGFLQIGQLQTGNECSSLTSLSGGLGRWYDCSLGFLGSLFSVFLLGLYHRASISRRCFSLSRSCSSSLADRKSTRLNSSHITISYAV